MHARLPRRSRFFTLSFVALTAVMTASSRAWAEPSLSDRETARSLMDDGDAKRDKGDAKGALKSYEAADAIMHVPTTGLEVARMQAQLGLLLEARETLGRVGRLPPKATEPPPFTQARRTAEQLMAELGARIPSVTVLVTNGEPGQPTIIVFDNEVVPPAASQAPRKVNPGRHTIIARSGSLERKQDVDVAERDSKTVTIDLRPAAPAVEHNGDSTSRSSGASPLPKILVYGGFGLGAVGIGVGAVTGLLSISQVSDVKKDCPNDVCPASRQGDLDSAKSLGTVSTIAFIAGGVGVGAGIVGLVLSSKEASAEPAAGTSAKVTVRPDVGPTWMGLHGTF
jgi:hypothetical protein